MSFASFPALVSVLPFVAFKINHNRDIFSISLDLVSKALNALIMNFRVACLSLRERIQDTEVWRDTSFAPVMAPESLSRNFLIPKKKDVEGSRHGHE